MRTVAKLVVSHTISWPLATWASATRLSAAAARAAFSWRRFSGSSRFDPPRSEEHTSELQSPCNLVCRLLLEKKKRGRDRHTHYAGNRHGCGCFLACRCAMRHASNPQQAYTPQPRTVSPFTFFFFFFNDTATTEIYTLSLHDALPIYGGGGSAFSCQTIGGGTRVHPFDLHGAGLEYDVQRLFFDQKRTRRNAGGRSGLPAELVAAVCATRNAYAAIGLVWNSMMSVAGGWFF